MLTLKGNVTVSLFSAQ